MIHLTIMHLELFHSIPEETEAEIAEEVPAMKAKEVLYCGGTQRPVSMQPAQLFRILMCTISSVRQFSLWPARRVLRIRT